VKTVTVDTAEDSNEMAPLELECADGVVGETFTSLKEAWASDRAVYSCTGTVDDRYGSGMGAYSAALDYALSDDDYGDEDEDLVNPPLADLLAICAAKDESAEGLLRRQESGDARVNGFDPPPRRARSDSR
jgi:hypothetical protein